VRASGGAGQGWKWVVSRRQAGARSAAERDSGGFYAGPVQIADEKQVAAVQAR
jgi:hypothetical protein